MVDPCKVIGQKLVKDIWKGVKRLSNKETNDLVDRLRGRANTIKAENPTLTTEQASNQAQEEMSREADRRVKKREQQVFLQENINKENKEFASRFENETTGLLHKVRGGEGQIQGSQDSLNYQLVTEGARFLSHKDGLLDKINKQGLKEKWWDKSIENQYQIAKAAWGMEVDDPEHKALAKIINDNAEWRRKVSNEYGADIGKLPNRIARTVHNPFHMRRMADSFVDNEKLKLKTIGRENVRRDLAFKHWKKDAEKYFNLKRTFPETIPDQVNLSNALREFWEANDSGTHAFNQDLESSTAFNTNKGFPLAKKLAEHRVFYFKSPEAQVDYLNKNSGVSLQEAVTNDIARGTRDIATLKTLGPNGINEMDTAMRNAVGKERTRAAKGRFAEWNRLKNVLNGNTSTVENYTVAKIFSNVRRATSYAKLGFAMLHSSSDLIHEIRTLEFNGMNPLQAHAEVMKNVFHSLPLGERKAEMDRISYCGRNVVGQMASRFSIAELPGQMTSKMDALFYRAIGLTGWDKIRTGETTGSLVRFLGQNRNVSYKELLPQLKHSLMLSNITEKEWDAVRAHPQQGFDKKAIICADIGRELPDSAVLKYLGKEKASSAEIERAKTRIEDLFANYFFNQEQHVVPLPSLREQATITRGLPRGSWGRELMGNLWQFKTFPLSFMRRIYGREFASGMNGKLFSSIDATKGTIFGMTQLAVEISMVNVFVNSAVALGIGNTIPDYTKPYNIYKAMLPLTALYGDILNLQTGKFGHNVGEVLQGASGGWLSDVIGEARTAFSKPGKAAVHFLKYDAPGSNFYLLKGVLDNLVLNHLAEMASPGSNIRAQRNLFKTTGETNWAQQLFK
jgi:hypothetical protein